MWKVKNLSRLLHKLHHFFPIKPKHFLLKTVRHSQYRIRLCFCLSRKTFHIKWRMCFKRIKNQLYIYSTFMPLLSEHYVAEHWCLFSYQQHLAFEIDVEVLKKVNHCYLLFALELRYDMVEPGVGMRSILPVGGAARLAREIMHIRLQNNYFRINGRK